LGGYLFIVITDRFHFISGHSLCLFKNLTGIPCPGCGMGRASLLFFQGKITASLFLQPLALPFFLFCLTAVVWILYDIKTGQSGFYQFVTRPFAKKTGCLIVIIILINWIWSIYKGL
jgi:hypothetical protein